MKSPTVVGSVGVNVDVTYQCVDVEELFGSIYTNNDRFHLLFSIWYSFNAFNFEIVHISFQISNPDQQKQ